MRHVYARDLRLGDWVVGKGRVVNLRALPEGHMLAGLSYSSPPLAVTWFPATTFGEDHFAGDYVLEIDTDLNRQHDEHVWEFKLSLLWNSRARLEHEISKRTTTSTTSKLRQDATRKILATHDLERVNHAIEALEHTRKVR